MIMVTVKHFPILLVLLTLGCEQKAPPTVQTSRTEVDQQVRKLREDNETEFTDLRGRWLAAEAQLIQLKRSLDDTRSDQARELKAMREAVQLLDTEMMTSRSTLGVASLGTHSGLLNSPEDVRLRRSAEEIICLRRRGAYEDVADVYARYGFESESDWSFAWATRIQVPKFEAELFSRLEVLCPRYPNTPSSTSHMESAD
jgi:hypothetical protein